MTFSSYVFSPTQSSKAKDIQLTFTKDKER